MIFILLPIVIVGTITAIGLAIYLKFFTPDDFSMWNNSWFGKDENKDQSYLDK